MEVGVKPPRVQTKKFKPRISLRAKLFLLLIIPFCIPLIGYSFVKNLEQFLRDNEQSLLTNYSRLAATVLSNQAEDFLTSQQATNGKSIYAYPINFKPLLDGYFDEWPNHINPAFSIFADEAPNITNNGSAPDKSLVDTFLTTDNKYYYLFIKVVDNDIRYYNPSSSFHNQASFYDRIVISAGNISADNISANGENNSTNYVFYTAAPGKVFARILPGENSEQTINEPRINGYWEESNNGYNLELKIPKSLIPHNISISLFDAFVETNGIKTTSEKSSAESYSISSPSIPLQKAISDFNQDGLRYWAINTNGTVLAAIDNIKNGDISSEKESILTTMRKSIYRFILKQPTSNFADTQYGSSHISDISSKKALTGTPFQSWHPTPDNRAVILSAAYPVKKDGSVIGAVIAEKTSNKILSLHNEAMERIIDISILAFLLTLSVLIYLTTHISRKILRLQRYTNNSISKDGRIISDMPFEDDANDEITDLAHNFSNMIDRVSQYTNYLENMSGRLSHELKTPLAIVSSSLDNISMCEVPEDIKVYHQRATDGAHRLRQMLSAMSEATRLEKTLESAPSDIIDIKELLKSYCEGYQSCFESITIESCLSKKDIHIVGNKDLFAQMLDKVFGNAADFHTAGTPIKVQLQQDNGYAVLSIENKGKTILPENVSEIFSPMVSMRNNIENSNHLGLGLYIVELICKYHQGHVYAENLADETGVCIFIHLPLSAIKSS